MLRELAAPALVRATLQPTGHSQTVGRSFVATAPADHADEFLPPKLLQVVSRLKRP